MKACPASSRRSRTGWRTERGSTGGCWVAGSLQGGALCCHCCSLRRPALHPLYATHVWGSGTRCTALQSLAKGWWDWWDAFSHDRALQGPLGVWSCVEVGGGSREGVCRAIAGQPPCQTASIVASPLIHQAPLPSLPRPHPCIQVRHVDHPERHSRGVELCAGRGRRRDRQLCAQSRAVGPLIVDL